IDSQIKYRGHRIELLEVDRALRAASRSEMAIAVPYPTKDNVQMLVGCIAGSELDIEAIRKTCVNLLPDYMIPSRIVILDEVPLNASGKIDRNAAARLIGAGVYGHENLPAR